jgi:hypothetical protein
MECQEELDMNIDRTALVAALEEIANRVDFHIWNNDFPCMGHGNADLVRSQHDIVLEIRSMIATMEQE